MNESQMPLREQFEKILKKTERNCQDWKTLSYQQWINLGVDEVMELLSAHDSAIAAKAVKEYMDFLVKERRSWSEKAEDYEGQLIIYHNLLEDIAKLVGIDTTQEEWWDISSDKQFAILMTGIKAFKAKAVKEFAEKIDSLFLSKAVPVIKPNKPDLWIITKQDWNEIVKAMVGGKE